MWDVVEVGAILLGALSSGTVGFFIGLWAGQWSREVRDRDTSDRKPTRILLNAEETDETNVETQLYPPITAENLAAIFAEVRRQNELN
jgi:hypothetical protein